MPERAAQVPYQPFSEVSPDTSSGNDYLSVRAQPQTEVGQALQQAGKTGQQLGGEAIDLATHYAKMATEAKANDVIANQFAPAAAKLRADFYRKQGIDAVNSQPQYAASLTDLRNNFLEQAKSPYEKQILNSWMSRHATEEINGATMHASQQLTQFEDQSHKAMLNTYGNILIGNYNQPSVVNQNMQSAEALIQKHGIDRGESPETIDFNQREFRGAAAQDMIGSAMARGDIAGANQIYGRYKDVIPGDAQLNIDKMMHSENMKQYGDQAAKALLSGKALPPGPGGPGAQAARQETYNAASQAGIDPNHALTVLRIESSDGTNLGKRGDIGQTGKGGELPEQAQNMVDELKRSKALADTATGGNAEPWQQYVIYQQGAGGGPTLLKAALSGSPEKAVDLLLPLYSSPKEAIAAIVNNGGNSTMTAGQFLDFIKNKYNSTAQRAAVVPVTQEEKPPSLVMQPGSTPVQRLLELDKVYPDALMRAEAIHNVDQRNAAILSLEHTHTLYSAAASASKAVIVNQAQTLATDPKFTSTDQIPPNMRAALADDPTLLTYLENRAKDNTERGGNSGAKDARQYGADFPKLYSAIHPVDPSQPRLIDPNEIYKAYNTGNLNSEGVDKLISHMSGKKSMEPHEEELRKLFLQNAKNQISGADEGLHIKDPKGEELFLRFMIQADAEIDRAKADGKSAPELYSPDGPIAKSIQSFKRPMSQWLSDMQGGAIELDTSTPDGLKSAVTSGKMSRAEGEAIAIKNGWIRDPGPQVPLP